MTLTAHITIQALGGTPEQLEAALRRLLLARYSPDCRFDWHAAKIEVKERAK